MIEEVFTSSYTTAWEPEKWLLIVLKYILSYLSVSAVMFCEQFLAFAVHIDRSDFLCNLWTFM